MKRYFAEIVALLIVIAIGTGAFIMAVNTENTLRQECAEKGGVLMRTTTYNYDCVKMEVVK